MRRRRESFRVEARGQGCEDDLARNNVTCRCSKLCVMGAELGLQCGTMDWKGCGELPLVRRKQRSYWWHCGHYLGA
jgi:hypothetical protein